MIRVTSRSVASPIGEITLFDLVNASGAHVQLSTLGAGITAIRVPDRWGRLDDVVLGYADVADYLRDDPCAGRTPGRFANRIALGRFAIDGHCHQLAINNPPNALHGGPNGFHNRLWTATPAANGGICFTLHSPDGDEGYPGNLVASTTYTWTEHNELLIEYRARTDAPTAVNLTNHAYFNLAGCDSGSCLAHKLLLYCHRYLPCTAVDIPIGTIAPVEGTAMDFTVAKPLGRDLRQECNTLIIGKGYNHYFLADARPAEQPLPLAVLIDDASGRMLTVLTDYPGVMLYTGNWLDGSPTGKSGRPYRDHEGVAIECQLPPDAPNQPYLCTPLWRPLRPGEEYRHSIIYRFSVTQ